MDDKRDRWVTSPRDNQNRAAAPMGTNRPSGALMMPLLRLSSEVRFPGTSDWKGVNGESIV